MSLLLLQKYIYASILYKYICEDSQEICIKEEMSWVLVGNTNRSLMDLVFLSMFQSSQFEKHLES